MLTPSSPAEAPTLQTSLGCALQLDSPQCDFILVAVTCLKDSSLGKKFMGLWPILCGYTRYLVHAQCPPGVEVLKTMQQDQELYPSGEIITSMKDFHADGARGGNIKTGGCVRC